MNAPMFVGGFADPVHGAQATFRCILRAMSRPGAPVALPQICLPPRPLMGGMAALALALLDCSTSVWLHGSLASDTVRQYLRLRTGVAIVDDPDRAAFALIDGTADLPPLDRFDRGDAFEPHLSATLIIAIPSLTAGRSVRLAGPGIETTALLAAVGLDEQFWRQWDENAAGFPRGFDVLLTDETAVCGLPRTTRRL